MRSILAEQRELNGHPVDGSILRGKLRGQPLKVNNLARRVVKPVLAKAEPDPIAWHSWHALRRGVATDVSAVERDPNAAKAFSGTKT